METQFPIRIPAFSISQPIGRFFLCGIQAKVLRAVTYSTPAEVRESRGSIFSISGIQRRLNEQRLNEIARFIDGDESTFPNTIILSANYREDGEFETEEDLQWRVEHVDGQIHHIVIPTGKKLGSIIDGQHRLEGFEHVTRLERLDMELPCSVFMNLPRPYQADIFATINFNQKRVDKSLAYQLFGYDLQERDRNRWPPDMLALFIARILNSESTSPFHKHVRLALLGDDDPDFDESGTVTWRVSIATLIEGIVRLVSSNPKEDRAALLRNNSLRRDDLSEMNDRAPLRDLYCGSKDQMLFEIVRDYFAVVAEVFWKNAAKGSFVVKTVGVLALFDLLRAGLLAGVIDRSKVASSARSALSKASKIDFSDNFFQASGTGRVRVRGVIAYAAEIGSPKDLEIIRETNRLLGRT